MIPVRALVVAEPAAEFGELRALLEASGFEVALAGSFDAALLVLARWQPEVLVLNPYAGRSTPSEWRRAVSRHRIALPLPVLLLGSCATETDQQIMDEVADLGVVERHPPSRVLERILVGLAAVEESMSGSG